MGKVKSERMNAEIVIIGGGGSGLTSALSAVENGCKNVMVIEKSALGGNSSMAHDLFGVESPVQKRMGIDARRDEFFKIAMQWANWSKINPRIIRAFIDKSGETIGWLLEKGVNFELGQYYINQMPRVMHTIEGEGRELMKTLAAKCREHGIKILTQTPGQEIIREANSLKLCVLAGKEKEIVIDTKCIIFASGGYAANKEMMMEHCNFFNPETMLAHGVKSNTGDGIRMATEIGASTAGLGHIMFHGPAAPPAPTTSMMAIGDRRYPVSMLIREPALWVNKKGKRFIDEGHNFASFASATTVAQQPEGIMYTVFDDTHRQQMEEEGLNWPGAYGGKKRESPGSKRPFAGVPLFGLGKELHLQLAINKNLRICDSLDEIANWIGAKPSEFAATVDEYNESCIRGYDSVFCKDSRYMKPLLKAPFYALRGQAFVCDTVGGIKINERMEVLDSKDDPIPGLFAAGSTTGCWETECYCYKLTGHLLGFALNSGRIAGENAAKYVMDCTIDIK